MANNKLRGQLRRDHLKRGRSGRGRLLWLLLLFLLIPAGFAATKLARPPELENERPKVLPPVRVVSPERGTLKRTYATDGHVTADTTITIYPQVSGTLVELAVEVGRQVDKGGVIARIDRRSYELRLQQAESSYRTLLAESNRARSSFESGSASRQRLDQIMMQYESARAQYELAELQLSFTTVTSPIRGVILEKHTEQGALAAPQFPIATVGNLERLFVVNTIPELYYDIFLDAAQTMEIHIARPAAPARALGGGIESISPVISPRTKTFEVECRISGDISNLRPGMSVHTTFVLDQRADVYSLPFATLLSGKELWYFDSGEARARRMAYEPEFFTDERFVIPPEYAGYAFIIEGQHFIRDGQEVRLIDG